MARVQIDLPEKFIFTTELALYGIHINRGGHLDNAMVLSIASEARSRFLESLGYSDLDVQGLVVFTADALVQYISEGHPGEVMIVEVAARDLNKYGFDMVFRLSEKTSRREVARGKYGFVFYDMKAKKVSPMPEDFRAKISR